MRRWIYQITRDSSLGKFIRKTGVRGVSITEPAVMGEVQDSQDNSEYKSKYFIHDLIDYMVKSFKKSDEYALLETMDLSNGLYEIVMEDFSEFSCELGYSEYTEYVFRAVLEKIRNKSILYLYVYGEFLKLDIHYISHLFNGLEINVYDFKDETFNESLVLNDIVLNYGINHMEKSEINYKFSDYNISTLEGLKNIDSFHVKNINNLILSTFVSNYTLDIMVTEILELFKLCYDKMDRISGNLCLNLSSLSYVTDVNKVLSGISDLNTRGYSIVVYISRAIYLLLSMSKKTFNERYPLFIFKYEGMEDE